MIPETPFSEQESIQGSDHALMEMEDEEEEIVEESGTVGEIVSETLPTTSEPMKLSSSQNGLGSIEEADDLQVLPLIIYKTQS
jgi:hypothetical protein